MAAVTVTASSLKYTVWGDEQVLHVSITSVDDADTFAAGSYGFNTISNAFFTPTTAVVAIPSFSGTTVTFKVAAGSVAGTLTVVGN